MRVFPVFPLPASIRHPPAASPSNRSMACSGSLADGTARFCFRKSGEGPVPGPLALRWASLAVRPTLCLLPPWWQPTPSTCIRSSTRTTHLSAFGSIVHDEAISPLRSIPAHEILAVLGRSYSGRQLGQEQRACDVARAMAWAAPIEQLLSTHGNGTSSTDAAAAAASPPLVPGSVEGAQVSLGGPTHLALVAYLEVLGDTQLALGAHEEALKHYRALLLLYQTLRGEQDGQAHH